MRSPSLCGKYGVYPLPRLCLFDFVILFCSFSSFNHLIVDLSIVIMSLISHLQPVAQPTRVGHEGYMQESMEMNQPTPNQPMGMISSNVEGMNGFNC